MAKKLIEAENISKFYRLGILGSRSLKEDIKVWWSVKLNRPVAPVPEGRQSIWALRDIHFDVYQGDVLGLVGKNGAGKSTLLKIISRITLPTTGRMSGYGRIASLLEVGTGFHAELTCRENVYLNGHIMGMKKKEIDRKFDEIVDFSGVSRFVDTPVKRYSSGMYVRLAFAVAAHLDPEIMVIDEVLAVGDIEFQQKCLAKIKSISSEEGKTILFVSHNIHTLRNTCNRALVLDQGKLIASGDTDSVLASYERISRQKVYGTDYTMLPELPGNENIRFQKVELLNLPDRESSSNNQNREMEIQFEFLYHPEGISRLLVVLQFFRDGGEMIFEINSENYAFKEGQVRGRCRIPDNFLNDGHYTVSMVFVGNSNVRLLYLDSCFSFEVHDKSHSDHWNGKWSGIVRPAFPLLLDQDNRGTGSPVF